MIAKHRKLKRRPNPPLDAVLLQEPRYVASWGYEHNFQTELRVAAGECGWREGIEAIIGDYTQYIFERHPDLAALFTPWQEIVKKAAAYEVLDILSHARTEIVKRYIRDRLKRYIRHGNERKLVFSPLPQDLADLCPLVWHIIDAKHVQTGTYEAGSRQHYPEEDFDPPALINQKRHLLYLCYPAGANDREFWLLAKDTITLAEYEKRKQVAKRLMQFP